MKSETKTIIQPPAASRLSLDQAIVDEIEFVILLAGVMADTRLTIPECVVRAERAMVQVELRRGAKS